MAVRTRNQVIAFRVTPAEGKKIRERVRRSGLSQQEYEAMSPQERETACQKVEERFRRAGAHFVVRDLSQLPDLVHACGFKNMRR